MKTEKSLPEIFTDIYYSFQQICDDFADATGKPTQNIDDYLD